MTSLTRHAFAQTMDEGRHDEVPLCTRCYGDLRTPDYPFDRVELSGERSVGAQPQPGALAS